MVVAEYRELRSIDWSLLQDFFVSLSPETCSLMNRFGENLYYPPVAYQTAQVQCYRAPSTEKGYVAVVDERIVGYGFLRLSDRARQKYTANLGIVVADAWQGKGIGRGLMNEMIASARLLKLRKIWLQTYATNLRAIRLYESLGFIVEGLFVNQEWLNEETPMNVVSMALFLK